MKRILIAGDCGPRHDARQVIAPFSYFRAVRAVGAVAAAAYAQEDADAQALAQAFDALILAGGGDIPSALFGQTPHAASETDDPARDASDRLLFDAFRQAGKRVLGICRGCQGVNVFLGGTLHQHLPDAFDPVLWHAANMHGRHGAAIAPDTRLARLLGPGEIRINSSHHQAIDKPGEGLRVCATAPDGVIEAAEGNGILLLQWHPEKMGEAMRPIFEWIAYLRDA